MTFMKHPLCTLHTASLGIKYTQEQRKEKKYQPNIRGIHRESEKMKQSLLFMPILVITLNPWKVCDGGTEIEECKSLEIFDVLYSFTGKLYHPLQPSDYAVTTPRQPQGCVYAQSWF